MRFQKAMGISGIVMVVMLVLARGGLAADDGTWKVVRPAEVPANFPGKEIRYIYPFSTGSMADAYFRVLVEKIKEKEGWSKSIMVVQREGAGGDIGWSAWAQAKPDGYTIGFAPTAMLIPAIAKNRPYRASNVDFVFTMMSDPGAIGVAADSPINSLQELVQLAKDKPGTVSMAVTSGIGQEGLAIKQIQHASGAKFNIVPFDGNVAVLTAVAGGHADAFCLNVGDCSTFLEEKSIKVLATGNSVRSEFLPEVPTYTESGYNVIQVNSRAIGAPKGTPEPILRYLSDCFVAAANDPDVKKKMEGLMVPYDTKGYLETTKTFADFQKGLEELWATQPWE